MSVMSTRADAAPRAARWGAVASVILALAWMLTGCTSSGSDSSEDMSDSGGMPEMAYDEEAMAEDGGDSAALVKQCAARKVAFVPGNAFAADMDAPNPGFRLNFSAALPEKIEEGIRTLGDVIRSYE